MKHIIVPVDGSDHSLRALEVALDLARQRGERLRLVHVVPQGGVPRGLEKWAAAEHLHESVSWLYDEGIANNVLSSAEERIASDAGVASERLVEHGEPAKRLIELSKDPQAAMIVMGSRGLSDIGSLVLGSVAHKVAHAAACPVVTVT